MRADLAERERELGQMQEELAERDRLVKEVELKLLSATQELAASSADYARHMKDKEEELEQYKVCQSRPLFHSPFLISLIELFPSTNSGIPKYVDTLKSGHLVESGHFVWLRNP